MNRGGRNCWKPGTPRPQRRQRFGVSPRPAYRRPLTVFERPGIGVRLAPESVFDLTRCTQALAGVAERSRRHADKRSGKTSR